MSNQDTNIRDFAAQRRKHLEAELLTREPERMKEYLEVCSVLQALGGYTPGLTIESMLYAQYRTPLAAVIAFLEMTNKPTTKEIIAQSVCDGGYSLGEKRRFYNVINAIEHNLLRSKNPLLCGDPEGLLGLQIWDGAASTGEDASSAAEGFTES